MASMNTEQPEFVRQEAARLKAIYNDRKRKDKTLNQAVLADLCGWSSQGTVSQYMTGDLALNLQALLKFAAALAFDPAEVSPRLVDEVLGALHFDKPDVPPVDTDHRGMDAYEIRAQRLREIIGDRQLKDFANAFDLDASYLSQLLNGHRRLGERAAVNIERKLGLTPGALGLPKVEVSDIRPMSALALNTMTEAAKLKAIYQTRKKADPSLTQEAIAERAGWTGQSVVSQYLNGRIPLNLSALLKFASILDFDPSEVSPRLAGELPSHVAPIDKSGRSAGADTDPSAEESRQPRPGTIELTPFEVWTDETPLGDDEVEIPFFKEVELAAGKGSEVMLETGGRKLRFGKRTLQRKGIPPEAAAAATVTGNSMEPVLPDGSTVGVDTSRTQVTDGQMYAISHEGQLRVKVLYRTPGNGLRLRSYNSDEHPDERYDGPYVAEHIRVIGKVFWYSVLI